MSTPVQLATLQASFTSANAGTASPDAVALAFRGASGAGAVAAAVPGWVPPEVLTLLRFDGNLTDVGVVAKTWTPSATPAYAARSGFGQQCNLVNGGAAVTLSTGTALAHDLGSGDWTLEMACNATPSTSLVLRSGGANVLELRRVTSADRVEVIAGGQTAQYTGTMTGAVAGLDHVVLQRRAGQLEVFCNGNPLALSAGTPAVPASVSCAELRISGGSPGASVDEVRIVRGRAVYAAGGFAAPAAPAPAAVN